MNSTPQAHSRATERTCVIYMKAGAEHATPWFTNYERAQRALRLMRSRYGAAVIFRD